MRIFEIVKENINLREAAELYGIDVNRYGKALCPFHNDRHPSLYVADDHYYASPALAAASYPFVDLPSGDTLRCKLFPADKFHKICYLFDNR